MARTRLLGLQDVPDLTALLRRNRAYHAPWDPERAESYFTELHQRSLIERALAEYDAGRHVPLAILDDAGTLVGRINVNTIVRGAFCSASIGYWVDESYAGRGYATGAVADVQALAFGELGLHRLQADILPGNDASRRVLERSGFVQYGTAPDYLHIAGRWQTCLLFQVVSTDPR